MIGDKWTIPMLLLPVIAIAMLGLSISIKQRGLQNNVYVQVATWIAFPIVATLGALYEDELEACMGFDGYNLAHMYAVVLYG
jgi:hypothetical protein